MRAREFCTVVNGGQERTAAYAFLEWKSQNTHSRTCITIDWLHVSSKIVDIFTRQVVSIYTPLKTPFFLDFYIEMYWRDGNISVFHVFIVLFSKFKVRNVKMPTAESVKQI